MSEIERDRGCECADQHDRRCCRRGSPPSDDAGSARPCHRFAAAAHAELAVNVSDPSLGFTAGGGWFYWPGTTDRTTFGYTMKYTKKLTNVQGSLVMIRHLADGTSYRVKSNSISGLAIGKGTGFNWASFTGKNTYRDRTWADPLGNDTFNAYVEDWGEPGTKDRFWIEFKDKDRQLVATISIGRTATVGAVTLNGGNIQAPLPSSIA